MKMETTVGESHQHPSRARRILGWVATGISTLLASLWAFWGAIENFHEGWYSTSVFENLVMMIIQYGGPMLVFLILTSLALRFPIAGGLLHIALGFGIALFFGRGAGVFMIGIPLAVLGLLYVFGRPSPRKRAYQIAIGLPVLIYLGSSVEPVIRVAGRQDDGIREARTVEGNGVSLIWAPEGPGWPNRGIRWEEAQRICSHLTEDGKSLADSVLNVWRLPTIDEAVRSLSRHGTNCGGVWDPIRMEATYETMPDKESPLWDTHSPIIYWWTSTEKDSASVFRIVFNGGVHAMPKDLRMGSMAFRAVRPVK
jgi:hypothetical protein